MNPINHYDSPFITERVSFCWPEVKIVFGYVVLSKDWQITIGGKNYILPKKSYSNFGTIPWYARWLISKADMNFCIGFIIHDILCGEFNAPLADWKEANKALLIVNKAFTYQLGRWQRCKRHIIYGAVKLNGIIKRRA